MRPARLIPLLALALTASVAGQLRVQPVAEHPDETALRLMLRKLKSSGTFMQTAAHPDDEDNALLAMLGHGQGMRTILASATRGDGGQNEIGPELFQALGVLRTEELLAVHRFDGAEQFFTRAIDFGYSFSVEETLEKWGHEEILGDFVRLIRMTRPDVIAGFLCGGTGGGQHHQASALITREAFRAAADPGKYPDQIEEGLRPWQAARVFCTDFSTFGPKARAGGPDLLTVSVSQFEPLLGRTYTELGIEARSMHKCQGTSQLLPLPGAGMSRTYRLQDTVLGQPGVAPPTMFEGIDTSLSGLARFAGSPPPPALVSALQAIAAAIDRAERAIDGGGPPAATPGLAESLGRIRTLRTGLSAMDLSDAARFEIDFRLDQKERQAERALVIAYGLRLEALANDGVVTVGQPVRLSILGSHGGPDDVTVSRATFAGFDGEAPACAASFGRAGSLKCEADLRVGKAPYSTPYWTPRADAARYDFDPDVPFGVPFRPSPFRVTLHMRLSGAEVAVERVVQYRYDDILAGEKRMELKVVPPFAVSVAPQIAVVPRAVVPEGSSRSIEVAVSNSFKGDTSATLALRVPQGWRVTPLTAPLHFSREDEAATVAFEVTPARDAGVGEYPIAARIQTPGSSSDPGDAVGFQVVEYPHIHRRHVIEPAATRLKIIDVTVPEGLRVGYIVGVGDQVPQAIEQLGVELEAIGSRQLASGNLARYDAIVTGVRAYERRPDLRANNHRLLEYARNGGVVIVQYNKFEFNEAQYGPYPARVSANRVTDESAPVEALVPDHPVFTTPNRIGPEAWSGWVQERGLYFLGDRDERYTDLVRLQDPFEYNAGPKTGALVEARIGKGRWIYLGLGLWRQLPAGTDGAYRLLANLLSLGRAR
ncbi:MAG TPA: PIG-L family deacetylase [Vicinamibacterales bacterium]|nr:PIG-L family deacetylase [Vicinamibacterales bacterium]